MPTVEEKVNALRIEFDTATDAVATVLTGLRDQLVGASTPEAVDAILRPVIDRLHVLGEAPAVPVPVDPTFPV
jgi:hypothetical protein